MLLRHSLDLHNTTGWMPIAYNQSLFPIPSSIVEQQFVGGCQQEEVATM